MPKGRCRFWQKRWVELYLAESIHKIVIILVRANPKPDNIFILTPRNGPIMQTSINSPDVAFWGKAPGMDEKDLNGRGKTFCPRAPEFFSGVFCSISKRKDGVWETISTGYICHLESLLSLGSSNATPGPFPEKSPSNSLSQSRWSISMSQWSNGPRLFGGKDIMSFRIWFSVTIESLFILYSPNLD